jgi:hypothetical protein
MGRYQEFASDPKEEGDDTQDTGSERVNDLNCYEQSLPYCVCSDEQYESSFPDLNFTLGGVSYYVPKEQYVFKEQYGWT